jgi:hypothetical protein
MSVILDANIKNHRLFMTVQLGDAAYWRFEAGEDGALRIFFTPKIGQVWEEVGRYNQFYGTAEHLAPK